MRWLSLLSLASLAVLVKSSPTAKRATPYGIDVSDYQPSIDWTTVVDNGISFAFIKATEGTGILYLKYFDGFTSFNSIYIIQTTLTRISQASTMVRPTQDSSVADTILPTLTNPLGRLKPHSSLIMEVHKLFVYHPLCMFKVLLFSGGWSGDGITLPGALDIECKFYLCPICVIFMRF
jgi:hypothetical protein